MLLPRSPLTLGVLALAGLAAVATGTALAQSDEGAKPGPEASVNGYVNKYIKLDPTTDGLKLPAGFAVDIVARGLGNARILAVRPNGTVYVTRRAEADVLQLLDTNRDGVYEDKRIVASRPGMHGIALDGDTAYLVTIKEVYAAPINADGSFGKLRLLTDSLPDAGQHANRMIAVGPDGKLYITAGSTCNECDEQNPENATMLQMNKDGTERKIYASGLRNTIGYDWNPRDGSLWGYDQGIDWLGDNDQPEELNRIEKGGRYGWPYVYAATGENPHQYPKGGLTVADWKAMSRPMVAGYTPHAAAMQMAFNRGANFPAAMQGDALVAFRGSWNRSEPSGYEVVRVRFDRNGQVVGQESFLSGFIRTAPQGGPAWTGRPTGLAFLPSGAMLVTDPENGAVYRVRYTGTGPGRALSPAPSIAPSEPVVPIASQRREGTAPDAAQLAVRTDAFADGQPIPIDYTNYGENASPALSWSPGPSGTQAYAVLVEDPDAGRPSPVAHWVAWNIPAGVTSLKEAVGGAPQLTEPKGMRQGPSERGALGYFGPRPPLGDKPHRYHYQVFALSAPLELLPGADREAVVKAMAGKVLASGDVVGTYSQPGPPPKKG